MSSRSSWAASAAHGVSTPLRLSFEPDAPPILSANELKATLRSLSAVPQGLVKSMGARHQTRARKGKGKVAKIGATVNRYYNEIASRPVPRNGISLAQAIQVEFNISSLFFTTNAAGLGVGNGLYATINGFSGASACLSVFDQYRIDQLEFWLDPIAAMGSTVFGSIVSAIDLDDAASVTGASQVQDHPGALEAIGGAGHYHKWKPHMAVAVYSGAFTSFANEPAGWIDSASPAVQHYGVKAFSIGFNAAIAYNYTLRAVVSFRAPVIS
jgi:hypothetical protein